MSTAYEGNSVIHIKCNDDTEEVIQLYRPDDIEKKIDFRKLTLDDFLNDGNSDPSITTAPYGPLLRVNLGGDVEDAATVLIAHNWYDGTTNLPGMSHLRINATNFDSGALFYTPKFLAQKIIVTSDVIDNFTTSMTSITADIEPIQFLKDTSTNYYVIGSTVTIVLTLEEDESYTWFLFKDEDEEPVAKFTKVNECVYTTTYKLTPYRMFNDSSDTITFTIKY